MEDLVYVDEIKLSLGSEYGRNTNINKNKIVYSTRSHWQSWLYNRTFYCDHMVNYVTIMNGHKHDHCYIPMVILDGIGNKQEVNVISFG